MKYLDVCLSPDLITLHPMEGRVVVIVDILRATSCMTAGIGSGVGRIRPFASLEDCVKMKSSGYLIAGERNGSKVDGFDLGNSPFDYMEPAVQGRNIAVTTTNGTVAIDRSGSAEEIVIGSFLNISRVADYLLSQDKSVLIVCAGWKGKVNLEDTLFAGALAGMLQKGFTMECDAPRVAQATYQGMKNNLLKHVLSSSHAQRLKMLNIHDDIAYCLKTDEFDVLPKLVDGEIASC